MGWSGRGRTGDLRFSGGFVRASQSVKGRERPYWRWPRPRRSAWRGAGLTRRQVYHPGCSAHRIDKRAHEQKVVRSARYNEHGPGPKRKTMPNPQAFVPSQDGFAFTNAWPSEPAVVLPTPFGKINIGNAAAGLCGGMVFAALDYWYRGIPPLAARPAPGEPLYRYFVRRLVDSWHLPAGVAQYYQWMNLPDGDSGFDVLGRRVVTDRGLAWRTIETQWPQITA